MLREHLQDDERAHAVPDEMHTGRVERRDMLGEPPGVDGEMLVTDE